MAVSGQIGIHATVTYSSPYGLTATQAALSYFANWNITSGFAAGQADRMYNGQRTVASGAVDSLDLAAGALADPQGAILTFVKVKALLFESLAANTTNLTIGPGATNGFQGPWGTLTSSVILKPGDFYEVATPGLVGWPVTPGTADLLAVTNAAGAAAIYNVTILGTSA